MVEQGLRPIQRISRRGLMASGMFAGLFAAAGKPVSAGTGGTLRLALPGADAADSWDPRSHNGLFMQVAAQGAVFDCLTEVAASGELRGELAESWECSSDATRWQFKLRHDVVFHDGRALTSADVAASLLVHRGGALAGFIVDQIAHIATPRADVVDITLHAPHVDFPFLLAAPQLIIAPGGDFSAGVGTGLYHVVDFQPGRSAALRRVPQHYKDGQAGWFAEVMLTAATPDVALRGLRAGDFDAIGDLDEATAAEAAQDHRLALAVTRGNRKLVIPLAARDALAARGVDRAGYAGSLGMISGDHPLGPAQVSLPASVDFDPDLAMPALAPPQLFSGGLTEDWAFSLAAQTGGPLAALGADPAFANLLQAARAEGDSVRRAQIYTRLQHMAETEGAALWPAALPYIDAHSRRLSHAQALGTLAPLDSARIAERWSFA